MEDNIDFATSSLDKKSQEMSPVQTPNKERKTNCIVPKSGWVGAGRENVWMQFHPKYSNIADKLQQCLFINIQFLQSPLIPFNSRQLITP